MYLRSKRFKLIAILTLAIVTGLSSLSSFAMKSPIPVDVNQVEEESTFSADSSDPIPENNISNVYEQDFQTQRYEAKRKLNLAKFNKLAIKKLFKKKFLSISKKVSILRDNLLTESDEKTKENIRMGIQYLEDDFGFSHFQYHIIKKECKKDIKKAEKFMNELENEHEVNNGKIEK